MVSTKVVIAKKIDNIINEFYDNNERVNWKGIHRYYGYFFSKYLDEKYKEVKTWNSFPIYSLPNSFTTSGYLKDITLKGDNKQMKELKNFVKNSKTRFIVIPLTLLFHQNIVIIDNIKKEIELFDSYGESFYKESKIPVEIYNKFTDNLKNFIHDILDDKTYKFYKPIDFFPKDKEFQNLEINYCDSSKFKVNSWGFCVVWSFYYAEMRISNPDITRNILVKDMISLFRKNISSIKKTSMRRKSSINKISFTKNTETSIKAYNTDICKLIRSYTLFLTKLDKKSGIFEKIKLNIETYKHIVSKQIVLSTLIAGIFMVPSLVASIMIKRN